MEIDEHEILLSAKLAGIEPPRIPKVLAAVCNELNGTTPNIQKIAALISTDSGFSADVLTFVNTAGYATSVNMTNAQDAVAHIGLRGIRALCNIHTWFLLNKIVPEDNMFVHFLWEYSVQVAFCAQKLTGYYGLGERYKERYLSIEDEVYSMCLFANSGAVYLATKFSEEYKDALIKAHGKTESLFYLLPNSGYFDTEYDSRILLSAAFAKSWLAPSRIVNAICAQDNKIVPPGLESGCARLFVHIHTIARKVIHDFYVGHEWQDYVLDESELHVKEALHYLKLSSNEELDTFVEEYSDQIRDICYFLESIA